MHSTIKIEAKINQKNRLILRSTVIKIQLELIVDKLLFYNTDINDRKLVVHTSFVLMNIACLPSYVCDSLKNWIKKSITLLFTKETILIASFLKAQSLSKI
ncbi:hypothetical protein EAG11_18205 [Flavobacterium sp. 140616W15]|nr:hypothetical protein [Flavobacterium sp. 140616W15]AYN05876.1 hypothetical protein EAG11_18205 [Flavobacterium sp. 140616W15]